MTGQFSSTVALWALCFIPGINLQRFSLKYSTPVTTVWSSFVRFHKCQNLFLQERKIVIKLVLVFSFCSVDMSGWSNREIQMREEVGVTVKY